MHTPTTSLVVTLAGPAATAVLALLDERYDHLSSAHGPEDDTVLTVSGIDQAGERALLNLLWDTGHEVRSVVRRSS